MKTKRLRPRSGKGLAQGHTQCWAQGKIRSFLLCCGVSGGRRPGEAEAVGSEIWNWLMINPKTYNQAGSSARGGVPFHPVSVLCPGGR